MGEWKDERLGDEKMGKTRDRRWERNRDGKLGDEGMGKKKRMGE